MSSFEKYGDWLLVRRLTAGLSNDLRTSQQVTLKRIGLYAEKLAKEHISKQDLNWKPLSEQYKKRKRKQGYSSSILVRSSSMFQAITSYVVVDTALAGVKRGVKNSDGEEIANIAKIMEYGSSTRNIPARKLWGPVFKKSYKYFLNEGSMLNQFRKTIARKYGI